SGFRPRIEALATILRQRPGAPQVAPHRAEQQQSELRERHPDSVERVMNEHRARRLDAHSPLVDIAASRPVPIGSVDVEHAERPRKDPISTILPGAETRLAASHRRRACASVSQPSTSPAIPKAAWKSPCPSATDCGVLVLSSKATGTLADPRLNRAAG